MSFSFIRDRRTAPRRPYVNMHAERGGFPKDGPSLSQGKIKIWEDNNPALKRPNIVHVLFNVGVPRMAYANKQYGSCGAPFGYKRFVGDIPKSIYVWSGYLWGAKYPYDYNFDRYYAGFSIDATASHGWSLPVPAKYKNFLDSGQDSFLSPDATTHKRGDWDVVFNGGNGGKKINRSDPRGGGAGSNGCIFGHGHNGAGNHGGGTGSNATPEYRGNPATHMHSLVIPELSSTFKSYVKGMDPDTRAGGPAGSLGASGAALVEVPDGVQFTDPLEFGFATMNLLFPYPRIPRYGDYSTTEDCERACITIYRVFL